jgi:hypothetical protein
LVRSVLLRLAVLVAIMVAIPDLDLPLLMPRCCSC